MAKIWTTVSCKPGKIGRVHCRWRGLRGRLSVVPPVEFPQCTRSEPDLGEVVPELGCKAGRTLDSGSRSDLLAGTVFLRRIVFARSLSIQLYRIRHGHPFEDNRDWEGGWWRESGGYRGRARWPKCWSIGRAGGNVALGAFVLPNAHIPNEKPLGDLPMSIVLDYRQDGNGWLGRVGCRTVE